MASYKLFPHADATIYSDTPDLNTGLDEILEIRNIAGSNNYNEVSRVLMKFDQGEVTDIFSNKVKGSNFRAYLKVYNTETRELPFQYTLNAFAVSQSWDMGIGKFLYSPYITEDVTWTNRKNGTVWWDPLTHLDAYTEMNYKSDLGGGVWYTTLIASQSFGYSDNKDIKMDVSDIIESQYSASIPNNGIILKFTSSLEFTTGSNTSIKFFSKDTHTVYPPHIEIVWDDSSYVTGSLSVLTTPSILLSVSNLKESYNQEEVVRMRLFCREQYPRRVFTTSSMYTTNKALPQGSQWALKDVKTDEYVINFETLNKISCDSTGNYVDLYMNGLQPERYYKLIVKTTINGSTVIIDNKSYFKVRI
jgi:hypothetical protein